MSDFQPRVDGEINSVTGQVAAFYFYIRPGQQAKTLEYANGQAFADYNKDGQLLGIELLRPCEVAVFDQIASQEPEPVLSFVRESIPRKMAIGACQRSHALWRMFPPKSLI